MRRILRLFPAWLVAVGCTARHNVPATALQEPLRISAHTDTTDARRDAATTLVVQAVGDIYLGGSGQRLLDSKGYAYPFKAIARIMDEGDLNIGNLEGPITAHATPYVEKKYLLRMEPPVAAALKAAGIHAVALANNHAMDQGPAGLADTLEALTAAGVGFSGAGADISKARQAAWLEVKGTTVALLSYSLTFPKEFYANHERAGTAFGHEAHVIEDVAAARQQAGLVIVAFHWGAELMEEPKPYQRTLAHCAIDAGADLIVGHHPHVLQGIEIYKQRPIFYSLGNFIFSSWSDKVKDSAIARVSFDGRRAVSAEFFPINVDNYAVELQPRPMRSRQAQRLIEKIAALSQKLGTYVIDSGNSGRVILD